MRGELKAVPAICCKQASSLFGARKDFRCCLLGGATSCLYSSNTPEAKRLGCPRPPKKPRISGCFSCEVEKLQATSKAFAALSTESGPFWEGKRGWLEFGSASKLLPEDFFWVRSWSHGFTPWSMGLGTHSRSTRSGLAETGFFCAPHAPDPRDRYRCCNRPRRAVGVEVCQKPKPAKPVRGGSSVKTVSK